MSVEGESGAVNETKTPSSITRRMVRRATPGKTMNDGQRKKWPEWFTWRSVTLRPGVTDAPHSGYRQEAT
jgi:hypothetical protein